MPLHVSDLSRPKYEVLVALINHDNETNYQVDDLMFDQPISTGDNVRNTSMVITGVSPPYVVGNVTVRYSRPNIASLPGASRLAICVGTHTRYKDIIDKVNALLGTHLEEHDYVDEDIPSFLGAEPGSHTFRDLVMTADNPVLSGSIQIMFHN